MQPMSVRWCTQDPIMTSCCTRITVTHVAGAAKQVNPARLAITALFLLCPPAQCAEAAGFSAASACPCGEQRFRIPAHTNSHTMQTVMPALRGCIGLEPATNDHCTMFACLGAPALYTMSVVESFMQKLHATCQHMPENYSTCHGLR